MPDFSTVDSRCLDSSHISISGQFKHRYPLNISCSKIFDRCKIKRKVTNLTQLRYVYNYDKNRYLEIFSKAAVKAKPLSQWPKPEPILTNKITALGSGGGGRWVGHLAGDLEPGVP